MSGSRAIVLSLSVRDADVVRQQLVQMGEQGERALQRLDAAAQRSASGGGMPAFSQSTREAGDNAGRFGQAMGSAGYQIQDFAVQVQMGQNAITAFGAQASQFLGVFGTGGAIAGAVLTVGLLAYQLSGLGQSGETAAEAMKRLGDEMEAAMRQAADLEEFIIRVNERFLSTTEAARQRTLRGVGSDIDRMEVELQSRVFAAANIARQLEGVNAEIAALPQVFRQPEGAMDTSGGFGGIDPARQSAAEDALRARRDRLQQELRDFQGDALRFERDLTRLRGLQQGLIEDGTNATPGTLREEKPDRPDRPARVAMGAEDVQGILAARTADLTRQFDAYNQAVNLSTAGLEGATPVLAEYARQQELLTTLLEAGIITEAQFGEEVERTSERLREQIEESQRRTERTGQFANQLGLSFSSAFEDAILKGKSFSDVLKGLEQDIARIIIRSAVTAPLANAIGGGVQSLMGAISFGGPRADGGPVSGGMAYLVGERGPEIVVPRGSGTVIPNDRIGGPSISQTFNIDARGADASMVPRLRAEMVAIARASNAELLDSIQRGGSAARIVGRRA
jgi:hypothetical protein